MISKILFTLKAFVWVFCAFWCMNPFYLQKVLSFSAIFALYYVVLFILWILVPLLANRSKFCLKMLEHKNELISAFIIFLFATIIHVKYLPVSYFILLDLLGLN